MKTTIYFYLCIFTLIGCRPSSTETSASTTPTTTPKLPNLIAIKDESDSSFIHPNKLYSWIQERHSTEIHFGQVNMVKTPEEVFAVTAPHVLKNLTPFPKSEWLATWINAPDGREITLAPLLDWKKFGFDTEPVETKFPRPNSPTEIRSTVFISGRTESFKISGTVQWVKGFTELKTIGLHMQEGSSVRDRLLNRAPTVPILGMVIPEQFRNYLQGSSGALVWQNDYPIGVFVAALFLPETPPLALIEPFQY